MLEIVKTGETTNDGEIFEVNTEFVMDGVAGSDWYGYNWYEPLEYSYEVLKWGDITIDRNINAHEVSIKGAELLTQSQIGELSEKFGCWIKDVIESGNYTKF